MAITDQVMVDVLYGQARVTTVSDKPSSAANKINIEFLMANGDINPEDLLETSELFRESLRDALLLKAIDGDAAARLALGYKRDESPQFSDDQTPKFIH